MKRKNDCTLFWTRRLSTKFSNLRLQLEEWRRIFAFNWVYTICTCKTSCQNRHKYRRYNQENGSIRILWKLKWRKADLVYIFFYFLYPLMRIASYAFLFLFITTGSLLFECNSLQFHFISFNIFKEGHPSAMKLISKDPPLNNYLQ